MCSGNAECSCALEKSEQEAREAAKSRGFREKVNAPGYACDGICSADLPNYQHRSLVDAGLAPPKTAPDSLEERELEAKVTANAISRSLGGPLGTDNPLFQSLVRGKSAFLEEEPRRRLSGRTAEDFLQFALEENESRDWTPRQKREMNKLVKKACKGAGSEEAAVRRAISAIFALPFGRFREWEEEEEEE